MLLDDYFDEDEMIDGLDGFREYYQGKEVEGELVSVKVKKSTVYKEIIFSLDNKKYRFFVEEIQD